MRDKQGERVERGISWGEEGGVRDNLGGRERESKRREMKERESPNGEK